MDTLNSDGGSDSQNIAVKGAALLLVIGEPFSEEHKKLILGEISKGFRCWDKEATGIDINDELAQIANRADLGEEGPEGERIIRHNSENLVVEILVNPQTQTVTLGVKNFLSTQTKYKHLIYAGHAFKGSGAWILQDDTYTFDSFAHAFKDQDVGNALRKQEGCSLKIVTGADGDWTNGHIAKNDISKLLDVKLNPEEKLDSVHGVMQFTAYLGNFVRVRQLNELLQSSDVVGSIRFSRPTLYIFPGCQGDSALFGISGFNLLVNGGYSRKACFWDFTRHLDRIDAALMTHLGSDNLYGFGSVLQRKSIENVHPEIGFMYVNTSDKIKALPTSSPDEQDEDSLHVNLAKEGNKLIQYAKQIGQIPQPCSRLQSGQTIEPINLYHKVGIGSLDMYILNPITDSKELKEFYQQWNQNVSQFGLNQHMPIQNTLSVCALLVWRPSDPNDNITRIFFPGNAPQHKVLEGLEKLKTLDILKHPQCTKTSLVAKPAAKKPSGLSSRPISRSKVSPVTTPRSETPKKEDTPKKESPFARASAPKARTALPSTQKAKKEKEDVNKKTMKAPEKPSKMEKTDKPKKTTSTPKGSAKSSASSTPKEVASPTKEPAKEKKEQVPKPAPSPKKEEPAEVAPVQQAPVPDILDTSPLVDPFADQVVNGGNDSSVDPPVLVPESLKPLNEPAAEQPESLIDITPSPVPVPDEPEQFQGGAMDKEKMLELGIYDEDHDIEEDLNAQQPASATDQRIPQMFGGMTDSMHEDLIGDVNSKNLMQGSFHGDLMSGSMHEAMFDGNQPFDGPSFTNGGSTIEELMTPEDDMSEEIQPQALPEPVAYAPESYGQEPDVIPTISGKEESQVIAEQQLTPTAQEPDLLSNKQEDTPDYDEDSTVPVDEKLGQPSVLETPDEMENFLPEDVKEKDLSEETEKGVADEAESLHDMPVTDGIATEAVQSIPETDNIETEPIKPSDDGQNLTELSQDVMGRSPEPSEQASENLDSEDVVSPATDETKFEQQMLEDRLSPEFLPQSEMTPEVVPKAEQNEEIEDHEMVTKQNLDERLSPDFQRETPFQEGPEPELDAGLSETPEVPDVIERPISPEPNQQEQEQLLNDDMEEKMTEKIENNEVEQQPQISNSGFNVDAPYIPGTSNSDDERPDSPDSQLGAQDLTRDSLERDDKEPSPMFESDDNADSLETEQADIKSLVGQVVVPEQSNEVEELRDSLETEQADIKSSVGQVVVPEQSNEVEELRDSLETEQADINSSVDQVVVAEQSREVEELRDSIERSVSPVEQAQVDEPAVPRQDDTNRDSVEKSVSSEDGADHRESVERSFEDETDETEDDDEDDDDESSSFEQEEATDEKCLLPDSFNEGMKPMETGLNVGPTDSLAEQPSDNLLSPESEYTDPSQGQLGYHEIDDQDGDSVEGLDEKDSFVHPPPQTSNSGFDQFGAPGFGSGPMSSPFNYSEQPNTNPFVGYGEVQDNQNQESKVSTDGQPTGFNPLSEWGEPMGLPSPAPPEDKNETAAAKKAAAPKSKLATKSADAKKTDLKKGDTKRPTSARPTSATKPPTASNGVPDKTKSRLSMGGSNASKATGANSSRLSTGGKTTSKPRPGSAPVKDTTDSKPRTNGTRRPATTTGSRSSPVASKMPPLPPFNPFYVDLTYIPNHGNPSYSDTEFFKRVRARYYVLSALSPDTHVLDALIEGKKTWEDKSLAVTVIPTYDNETLRLWMTLHKEKLAENKVEIAPSASRCTIQLQDHETSSSAYRLEF